MLRHRTAFIGPMMLVATELAPGAHLVRIHPSADVAYDRMIGVAELDGGATLFLAGWIGRPPPLGDWREAKAALFPNAQSVTWERRRDDGAVHLARFPV